jgi:glucose/arabinose dehydrogenase
MKHAILALLLAGCIKSADPAATTTAHLTVPAGFTADVVVSGLNTPTAMAFTPDGRLLVTDQGGQLRVVKNGVLLPTPALTVTVSTSGERGLDGVAVDPGFATNGYIYVCYTAVSPTVHNRVSRWTMTGDTAGAELALLDLDTLVSDIHNGSSLHFGTDGKLYVGVGENDVSSNAQSMTTRLGKLLRINPDGTIPTDNPFYGTASGLNRAIWALGFRNPFTFDVQPGTGRIMVNDVGNTLWEEVDDVVAGGNYGWPTYEGTSGATGYKDPLYTYGHGIFSGEDHCAVTGGAWYNPGIQNFPAVYAGKYFFADYCGGWIKSLDPATGVATPFASGSLFVVDLDVGPDGALYYLSRSERVVGRVSSSSCSTTQPPQITQNPASQTTSTGQPVTFTVGAVGGLPLTYQWQRGGTAISGGTGSIYTLTSPQPTDSGATFRVVVSNSAGSATSADAVLTVISNTAPSVSIDLPGAGLHYSGADIISYAGSATDPEDGVLPASAYTWQVDFHHDTHLHPFMPATTGATSGSFTVPVMGEASANVWYRIHLTVQDSSGATATTYRDVLPNVVTLTLTTVPAGLQVLLDGQPTATPASVQGVVGIIRTLGAAPNSGWAWASWSDGGSSSHTVSTPSSSTTYTATYTAVPGISLKVNFQLAGAPVPSGYDADTGLVYGARPNGFSYGWNVDHSSYARDRNVNSDQRLDTLIHFHAGGSWEVAIPNGTYDVKIAVGDPSNASTPVLKVEGVFFWGAGGWVTYPANMPQTKTMTITVNDGRLTLDEDTAPDMYTRIDYIEVTTH